MATVEVLWRWPILNTSWAFNQFFCCCCSYYIFLFCFFIQRTSYLYFLKSRPYFFFQIDFLMHQESWDPLEHFWFIFWIFFFIYFVLVHEKELEEVPHFTTISHRTCTKPNRNCGTKPRYGLYHGLPVPLHP